MQISRRSCKRQSKPFDRSAKSAPKRPPLSLIFFYFPINTSKRCCELKYFLKPYWYFDKISSKYSAISSNMHCPYTLEKKINKMLTGL